MDEDYKGAIAAGNALARSIRFHQDSAAIQTARARALYDKAGAGRRLPFDELPAEQQRRWHDKAIEDLDRDWKRKFK